MLSRAALIVVLILAACKKDSTPADDGAAQSTELCPRAASTPVAGDANGDGIVDIADAVAIVRAAADGGAAPACTSAVDLIPDGTTQLDDGFSLLIHLFEDGFSLPSAGCDEDSSWAPPACSAGAVSVVAPTSASGSFSAQVSVSSDLEVEAWSFGLTAAGCTITAATTDGTIAEPEPRGGPGLRATGFDATFVSDDGATTGVVLALMDRRVLPSGQAHTLLQVEVEPDSSTCSCSLTLDSGPTTIGQPVQAVVVADGFAYPLPQTTVSVDTCG